MCNIKRIMSLILSLVLILSSTAFAKQDTSLDFNDVPKTHWAYKSIHDLHSLKITDGIGNNNFGLGLTIKRSEFVAFLVKLMQWDLVVPEKGSFIDNMDSSKWYYAPIETALKHGVILNDTDKFRVDEPISREEMAMMIVRTLEYDTLANQLNYLGSAFSDVTKNTGYITIAKDLGIITGVGNNLFKPYDTAKREEAAAMMMRMYEKLNNPIKELNGFYAIRSANQMDMINQLSSVGFGWSRLEYDSQTEQVILNTTRKNNNEYAIPEGAQEPLDFSRENNASPLLMVFANNGMEHILTNSEVRQEAIDSIVSQINFTAINGITTSFDGVIIDFENLKGDALKEAFNDFLKELKIELANSNKKLYVAVHPKRPNGHAYYDGYDYKAIGEIADKVILMAHDYYAKQLTDNEMERGYTLTPITLFDEIYYALKAITDSDTGVQDVSKVMLQFSFDSVQWKLKDGKIINKYPYNPSYEAIQQRLLNNDVTMFYSEQYQNPYAKYHDNSDGTDNVLWYEDSRSIEAKIKLAKMFGIQGVSLWRLGNIPDYEEPIYKNIHLNIWQEILK